MKCIGGIGGGVQGSRHPDELDFTRASIRSKEYSRHGDELHSPVTDQQCLKIQESFCLRPPVSGFFWGLPANEYPVILFCPQSNMVERRRAGRGVTEGTKDARRTRNENKPGGMSSELCLGGQNPLKAFNAGLTVTVRPVHKETRRTTKKYSPRSGFPRVHRALRARVSDLIRKGLRNGLWLFFDLFLFIQ